jgi:hypothetical protein
VTFLFEYAPPQLAQKWIPYMDDETQRRWIAHCQRMAEATYALPDWCEDRWMAGAYAALGARWLQMAKSPPAPAESAPEVVTASSRAK